MAVGMLLAGACVLGGCAGTSDPQGAGASGPDCPMPPELSSASVAVNPGSQQLVINHAKERGLDRKYNLDLQVKDFQNPPATAQAIVQKATDFGFGALTTMAQARATGADPIMIGALATPGSGVFVPKDSPARTVGDLAGKNVGSFTTPGGSISSLVQAHAKSAYGVDLLADVNGELRVAPEPALIALMDQGQLDGVILSIDGTAGQQFLGHKRQILDLRTDFAEEFGFEPYYLGPVTTEEYAAEHCGEVRAYSSVIRDAIQDIQRDPSVWQRYVASIGQPPAAAATYQKLYAEDFVTQWGPEQVDAMKRLLTTLTPFLPENFPRDVDPGLFSLDYPAFNPR